MVSQLKLQKVSAILGLNSNRDMKHRLWLFKTVFDGLQCSAIYEKWYEIDPKGIKIYTATAKSWRRGKPNHYSKPIFNIHLVTSKKNES